MSEPLRVGVIGVGRIGAHHTRIAGNTPTVRLVGVAERDASRRRWVEDRLHVPAVTDYQELLPQVDAVVVAVPATQHAAVTCACLESGKHCLVEKPFGVSMEDGLHMVETAARSGVVLQVGYVEQFNPAVIALLQAVSGQPVRVIETQRLSPYEDREWDIDVVLDLMVHDLSLLLGLTQAAVVDVQAVGKSYQSRHVDYAAAQLRFADGTLARCSASRVTPQRVREVTVTTLDSFVRLDGIERKISASRHTIATREDVAYKQRTLLETLWIPYVEPLQVQFDDFVTCVREGRIPKVDGRHGLKVLQLARRIQQEIAAIS
ncbi:MAG: Gfo/Idh/MocA family oxidoreductase [Firmicutes bacterium]|nr:Gfo/Idh/MocA family oxidoreductase [Bacillota bacterium]